MKQAVADLWEFRPADTICITTNATVVGDVLKGTQRAVMGRGCALEAKKRFKGLDKYFALELRRQGNVPIVLMRTGHQVRTDDYNTADPLLVSFPVKHNWWEKADTRLIEQSARLLVEMADREGWKHITIPRPGCGNGGLEWEDTTRRQADGRGGHYDVLVEGVRTILEPILDDRFTVVTK